MLKLSIQHHPKRPRHLQTVLTLLNLDDVLEVDIIEDETNSASGMRKCFNAIGQADHLLVLQDDILPCKDLLQTCQQFTHLLPDQVISLYSNNSNISRAVGQHLPWMTINVAYGLCGYIIPAPLARKYLAFEPQLEDKYADDVKLSTFLRHHHQRVWCTCPSLVEHIGHETAQGFIHTKNRMADYFIGLEHSSQEIDWTNLTPLEITLESDPR